MNWLLDLLFPRRCCGCGRRGAWICDECRAAILPLPEARCRRCATPLRSVATCSACWRDAPEFASIACGFLFDGPMRRAVHQLKYDRARHLAAPLAEALLAAVTLPDDLDVVAPVPLHPRRLRQRGYNQSELLARIVADRLNVPLAVDILTRVRDTPSQTTLPAATRWSNVRGAFEASPKARGLRILLVDDVATTTGTLRAAASALKSAGATRIDAAVLARAP